MVGYGLFLKGNIMISLRHAKVLTTGQIAKLLHTAPRTVSIWIDKGLLKGYRLPGSLDRRVPRENLLKFLRERNIPIPEELEPRVTATASADNPMSGALDIGYLNELFLKHSIKLWVIAIDQSYPLARVSIKWNLDGGQYRHNFDLSDHTLVEGLLLLEKTLNQPLSTWKLA